MTNTILNYVNKYRRMFSSANYGMKLHIQNYYDVVTNSRIIIFDTETTGLDTDSMGTVPNNYFFYN